MDDYTPLDYRATKELPSYQFFHNQGWAIKSKDFANSRMHTAMKKICPHPHFTQICGGENIYFPFSEKETVLRMLATDLHQARVPFYNQIAYDAPGQGFRLAVDIDASKRLITDTELIQMVASLSAVLERYYVGKDIPLFVSTSGPKWKDGHEVISIHIIAHVKVSFSEAKQLIYSYRLALKADDSIDMSGLEVDDGIYKDKSAKCNYESCNLRLIYSHKKEKCLNTETDDEHQTCPLCKGVKFIVSRKVYEPKFVYRHKNLDTDYFKQTHDNYFNILKNHNLWVNEASDVMDGYQIPFGTLSYECELRFEKDFQEGKFVTNPKKRKRNHPETVLENVNMNKRFESFLRKITHNSERPFMHIRVRFITEVKTNKNHTLTIFVEGEGAGQCLYEQKDHGQGRIFFSYNVKTFTLRIGCFSKLYEACQRQWDDKTCIKFDVEPWVYSGVDPKQLPKGTHNAERTSLVRPTSQFVTTQVLDPDTSLSTLMKLSFANPHIIYKLK
jgi:hypothetical protein